MNLSTGIGAAAAGTIGYGLGDGLRIELEYRYASNPFTRVSGNNRSGVGASTGTSGSEQIGGPMVNLDYDFLGVARWVVPYIGVGIGYQRARLSDFSTVPAGTTAITAALAPTITSNDTRRHSRPRASSVRRFRSRLYQGWQSRRNTGSWH